LSSQIANSIQRWLFTGTLAGSLVIGGAVLSEAGLPPLRFPFRNGPNSQPKSGVAADGHVQQKGEPVDRQQAADYAGKKFDDKSGNEDESDDIETKLAKSVRNVRLNFMESSWKAVLNSYAKQVGATLIADPTLIPTARYSRADKTSYTAAEALKVLNRELLNFDLKLVGNSKRLELKDLPSTHPNYTRPSVNSTGLVTEHALPGEVEKYSTGLRSRPQSGIIQASDAREVPISTDPGYTRSSHIQLAAASESTLSRDPVESSLLSVPLQHRRPKEMANLLYRAFQKQCELINDGPDGLPAMRVLEPVQPTGETRARIKIAAPRRLPRFTIAMDQDGNQMCIQASPTIARMVAAMIRKLDVQEYSDSAVQLFASEHGAEVENMADLVRTQLAKLTRARNKPSLNRAVAFQGDDLPPAAGPEQSEDVDAADTRPSRAQADPEQPATRQRGARGDAKAGEAKPGLSEILGALRGDVRIETLPDLGVMILHGNEKDVERVKAIIQEIEKLSAGSTPDVHLFLLKNTNSEALAELLSQVYERLNGRRRPGGGAAPAPAAGPGGAAGSANQSVTIIPVVKPNAILIVASAADIESVLKLAEELDQPVDPTAEFKMFRLRSAVASQVLLTIQTFYEGRVGLGSRVLAVADIRTNSVLVHARPRDVAEVAALIKELDQSDPASVAQMKVFPLRNAVADELSSILHQTIQSVLSQPSNPGQAGQQGGGVVPGGGGGGAGGSDASSQALKAVKSTVLQYLSPDGPGERLLRSGILSDIRIASDGRTNSLIVTAPEESLPILEELIKLLDRPTSTVAEIKVFSLQNSDAKSMVSLLESLFASAGQSQQNALNRLGINVAGAEDASSGLVPLKFSVDSRTNSIVAVGAGEALRVVEAILIRLDESDVRQRQSVVFRLKNSPANDVATAVNDFLTSRRDLTQSTDGLVSPFEQIEREVIVVPERMSNSLLISATPRYFNEIKELVTSLDTPPQQVIIQALLVEVTLDNEDEFGMELGLQDSVLFRRSVIASSGLTTINTTNTAPNGVQTQTQKIISQTATPGFLFNNQQLGNNTTVDPGIVGQQALTNFALGRQNGDLGYGGLVLAAGSESVSVLLRALAATRRVDVLSRPQIRTLDNQLAMIQVGQEVPVVNGFSTTNNAINPIVEIRQAGIILQVVPRISPDGRVVMDVAAERSAYLPDDQGVALSSDPVSGRVIRAPKKDISTARASLAVSSDQTVVMGGMIQSQNTSIVRKVPILGDLPYLGLPFRYNFNQNIKKELLIFLTPRVIKTDADSEYIKQIETGRIHFMEADAEQIHGPIFATPAPATTTPSNVQFMNPTTQTAPILDDPNIPTKNMSNAPVIVPPAPAPVPDDVNGVKMMRRTPKRSSRPVAMTE
jgi:general secretion pathway protein D